tara:strand:- start:12936 stop:13115 length:180 start_codon:yes stop_codon:yes gene_type:complete
MTNAIMKWELKQLIEYLNNEKGHLNEEVTKIQLKNKEIEYIVKLIKDDINFISFSWKKK